MATIYDIANRTQLSPATVSRALSGKRTSEENRRKVLAAARELNYHKIARADPNLRTMTLTEDGRRAIILLPGRNGDDGAYAAARELGYSIILVSSVERSQEYIRHLLDSGAAQGILLHSKNEYELLGDCVRNHPTVLVGGGQKSHTVWIDQEAALGQLLEELLRCGCRRIWCGYGEMITAQNLEQQLREQVGLQGYPEVELRFFDLAATYFSQAFADHLPLVQALLDTPREERPDGLLLPNSVVASCVVNLLRMRGVRVPEDLAVVSAIGGDHDRACEPYLTSILPPYYELNYEGMKMLDNLISGRVGPQEIRYPHRIRYGGSTRPELAPFGEADE